MAVGDPRTVTAWLQNLPITWLVGNENGRADSAAQGAVYDDQVDRVKQAVKARFPDHAPADGLANVGNDRKLIQGYAETDDEFRIRCKNAWEQWELAGTWAELLFQLYWSCGLTATSTAIVQQNGYSFNLVSNPAIDEDPTTLLAVTPLGENYNITYPDPVPWWTFDDRDDLCSRFAIVVWGQIPGTIMVTARATFDGTSNRATATWSGPWDGSNYNVMVAPAVTTDGSIPVVSADGPSKTSTTVDVVASAPFTGYVDLLGWLPGGNPFAGPSESTQNIIRSVVNTWRPAKAKFMGVYVLVSGCLWGWPVGTTWGQGGLKWGNCVSAFIEP